MFVGEKGFEIRLSFVGRRIYVLSTTGIGEITGGEDQVVGGCGDLFQGVGQFSDIGEMNRSFNLVDDCFKQLIHVVCGGHAGGIIL